MANISMLMTTRSSDLDDQKSEVINQTETPPSHLTSLSAWNGLEETGVGSTLSCSLSQSLARKQMPDCPETQYCLEIKVIPTKDRGTTPPPPYAWQAQLWKTCSKMANLA